MPVLGIESLRKKMAEIDEPLNDQLKAIYLQGLGNIATGTPVDDGRARSNWFLSVGTPSSETTNETDGDPHLDRMPDSILNKTVYYANNLPYIVNLEYGGYPGVGPKTQSGAGGIYSDQAVGGWVRKELLIMRSAIRKIK